MKRFFFVLLCFQIGTLTASHSPYYYLLLFVMAIGISFLVITSKVSFRHGFFMVVILTVTIMSFGNYQANGKRLKAISGKSVNMKGTIQAYNDQEDLRLLKINEINHKSVRNCNIIIEAFHEGMKFSDTRVIEISGMMTLQMNVCRENPNVMSYATYLNSIGILGTGRIQNTGQTQEEYLVSESKVYSFRNLRIRMFQTIKVGINNLFDSEYKLYSGMILGSKKDMDRALYESFSLLGVSHILTVSGLHFGVLYVVIVWMCNFLKLTKRRTHGVVVLFFCGFLFIIGFKISAIRAASMCLLLIYSFYNKRPYDLLNILSMIGVFCLLFTPWMVINIGFQLSFSAVYAIGRVYPFVRGRVKGKSILYDLIILSLVIQVVSLPLTIYYWNRVYLLSALINTLVCVLIAFFYPISLLAISLNLINPFLASYFVRLGNLLESNLVFVVTIFSRMTFFSFLVPSPSFIVVGIWYGGIMYLELRKEFNIEVPYKIDICFGLIISLAVLLTPSSGRVIFIDVGQGDATLIVTENDERILIDTGLERSKDEIQDILLKNQISFVDYLIISHPHEDHFGGMSNLRHIGVGHVVYAQSFLDNEGFQCQLAKMEERGAKGICVEKGSEIQLTQSRCLFLNNSRDSENENNESLVVYFESHYLKILFTGDMEEDIEQELIQTIRPLDIDVVKVPHHGSKTSSTNDLIHWMNPEYGVISVGYKNRYNLPNQDVIKRYEQESVTIMRTDESGAISITLEENYELIEKGK